MRFIKQFLLFFCSCFTSGVTVSPVAPNYRQLFPPTAVTSCLSSGNRAATHTHTHCEGFLFLRVCRSTQEGGEAEETVTEEVKEQTAVDRGRGEEVAFERTNWREKRPKCPV